jgi:exodeoxyribonuclease V alpha subunit
MLNTKNNIPNHPQEILQGSLERFLFQNSDTGFIIAVIQHDKEKIIIRGILPSLQIGQEVELHGTWDYHKKFGKQFNVSHYTIKLPQTLAGIKKYLGSGLIKGIGEKYAEKLVHHFGLQTLTVIDKHPERLTQVIGIGEKRIATIIEAWKNQKEIADFVIFMQEKGISVTYALKIYKHYRHNAYAVLQENPYRLADEIWGIGFKLADQLALKIGFHRYAPQRIAAGILYILSQAHNQGHLYKELEEIRQETSQLLELSSEHQILIKNALHKLYNDHKIKIESEQDKHYLTTTFSYEAEQGVAQKLINLLNYPSHVFFDLQEIYQNLRVPLSHEIALNDDQQQGILSCLQHKVTIITGGPGTGKTTLIKKLITFLEKKHLRYKLTAPTGRAAQRMLESTGCNATTLHRLLEFDVTTMRFSHNEQNVLPIDFLIVDEASMIDIFLAHSLLKAIPFQAHLIFMGDIDQLPSVGAGNFLRDCIASTKIPCIRLTQIFRQAQDSLIVVNAHRINQGEFPLSSLPNAQQDFLFIKELNPENLITHLKRILFIELPRYKIQPQHVQILVPMNKGIVGAQNLNYHMQQLLNPAPGEHIIHMGMSFKVNDKVMQIRNNYEKIVFNGDIGTISMVNLNEKVIIVDFQGKNIEYAFDELHELILAYAITIHKSQGSEYPAIIIPLFTQHFTLLRRNLVYTALTRAKKVCFLVGQPQAVAMAIKNNQELHRLTFLKKFLNKSL